MDHSRFNTIEDGVDLLTIRADLEFKTTSSISFTLHDEGYERGWIDVHHPCDGHIKLRIRGHMNESRGPNLSDSTAHAIIDSIFDALAIPRDETYEARFYGDAGQVIVVEQRIDRDGLTDAISFEREDRRERGLD